MKETRRILIVDDSAEDRESYRRLLREDSTYEYEISETDSGEDGLARCTSGEPDCVLLDYHLPDLDGLEFLNELFGMESDSRTAVVMLTGVGNATVAVEAMKNGAQEYLVKGEFSQNEFQRAVDSAIQKNELMMALDRQRGELARSNEELSQFAYAAAHDLQAPLRRTKAFCELLQANYSGQFDEEGEEYLQFIVQCTNQMQELVSELLEYGRAGTSPRKPAAVRGTEAVDEAISNLAIQIEECNANVTHDDLPVVVADHIQLVQVFQNLLGNAIKYHGDRTPEVKVSASQEGTLARFAVQDNGIGIDPQYADQVFAVFRRLHSEDEYAGSGIGLATCRKIVQRHGGTIWFESQPGEGSTFFFTIPLSHD